MIQVLALFETQEENINVVMEQIKKHEVKSVKNETSIKDTKMDIYHNIYMNL